MENSHQTKLGKRLQTLRQEKGFTLDNVIEKAGLSFSRSTLSAIENGSQDISAIDLFMLSFILNFDMCSLLRSVDEEVQKEKFSITNE